MRRCREYPLFLRLVSAWLPFLAWMALIYWFSDQPKLPHPGRQVGISDYLFDYSAHAFMFGMLTLWGGLVIKCTPFLARSVPLWASGGWAALYAASDEVHQIFVPGRWAKFSDWLADVLGVLLALGTLALWRHWLAGWFVAVRRRLRRLSPDSP